MPSLSIDSHSSAEPDALRRAAIASLEANRIDSKFLYATSRQAGLWRQVFLRHSPIHGNLEFARIYREAFARVLDRLTPGKFLLAGLGCGTGAKELEFHASLQSRGYETLFAAIDVSRDLVVESVQKLTATGAEHRRSLVCDLAEAELIGSWLDGLAEDDRPRLITFFGLTPNFSPSAVSRIFRSVLRPGDILLASAHLAPVADETPGALSAAMRSVLPQYDNPETHAWLAAALEEWGLENLAGPPEIKIDEIEGIPAFLASAPWKTHAAFEKWGHRFSPHPDAPLRLFSSLRYTPALFEAALHGEGFAAELLSITACRQEAIWAIQAAGGTVNSSICLQA